MCANQTTRADLVPAKVAAQQTVACANSSTVRQDPYQHAASDRDARTECSRDSDSSVRQTGL